MLKRTEAVMQIKPTPGGTRSGQRVSQSIRATWPMAPKLCTCKSSSQSQFESLGQHRPRCAAPPTNPANCPQEVHARPRQKHWHFARKKSKLNLYASPAGRTPWTPGHQDIKQIPDSRTNWRKAQEATCMRPADKFSDTVAQILDLCGPVTGHAVYVIGF